MKDRLGNENEKNFKSDLKGSSTKEIIDTTKELEWKDQQTEVGNDPYKMGEDLEKESLKRTKGESFKNVGNSANKEGDEIPKRNLTDEEANEVDLYRKGLGDVNFDNEPSEKYMERMKADMGEEEFKKREERMEFEVDKPMYNKDTQPVEDDKDTHEKKQHDKDKLGYKLSESMITGKYKDIFNKNKYITFKINESKKIEDVKDLFKLSLDGLGNSYDSKANINEDYKAVETLNFYTDGNEVWFTEKKKENINESEVKNKKVISEEFSKMQKLIGYNTGKLIDTKTTKVNRGF
jgi:hypothetical protein